MKINSTIPVYVFRRSFTLTVGIGVMLSGCAIEPIAVTQNELTVLAQSDLEKVRAAIPAVTTPLTLEEAIARALKYNLEHRTKLMEQAFATGQLETGKFDLLPKLMTTAGYEWRDNDNIRNSTDSITGAPSLANPSISSEKQHFTGNLGLTWNLLDFGISYYTARQNSDRVLIANERRRKAMHNLIQNVRTAFWRTVATEKLEAQVNKTINEAETALVNSRRIENERIKSPGEALRYQRNLLENLRLLESVSRELASARIDLASLIGISPGTQITIVEPDAAQPKELDIPVERMEEIAMANNADIREQFYNARIATLETRKVMTKLLPNLSFDYSYRYDNDSYLINQEWTNAGVQIGFNLLNLLSAPTHMNVAEFGVKLEENRRMAMRMSVLTQVHLARFQYSDALRQYLRAIDIADVDNRLSQFALSQEQSQMASKLDRIAAHVTSILSAVRKYHAMAKVQEAISKVKASMGVEPHFDDLNKIDLPEMASVIKQFLEEDETRIVSPTIKSEASSSFQSAVVPALTTSNLPATVKENKNGSQVTIKQKERKIRKKRSQPNVQPTSIQPGT
ncbi:Transporter [Gammaproteobacteria bacterium]